LYKKKIAEEKRIARKKEKVEREHARAKKATKQARKIKALNTKKAI
jgi:hypothetical protein